MKSAYIFFNPKSGKDEQALAQEVKSYLIEHDFQDDYVRIITPSSVEEAVALAKKASEDHIDLVIPLGGDGTINKICGGVYAGGAYPTIGLVPAGTVNNFSKALNIPQERNLALENLLNGHVKSVDICKVNDDYMISSLTLGLLADIAANVTSEMKRKLGPFAFVGDAYRILKRNRSYSITLAYDNNVRSLRTRLLLITMTNSIAGMPAFSPEATIDDGLFRVYTMEHIHFFKLLLHLRQFRKGDFSQVKEIKHFHTNNLTISTFKRKKSAIPKVRIDGDPGDQLPVKVEVIPKALKFIIPNSLP
ncbi:TPA: diacylglycerol kinase family protein [Streptococcus agalactiae]